MTDYKAMKEAVRIAEEELIIFNRAIDDLKKEEEQKAQDAQPTHEQWEWMARQECFWIGVSDISQEDAENNARRLIAVKLLTSYERLQSSRFVGSSFWKYAAIARLPNIIQPWFGGPMPYSVLGKNLTMYPRDGQPRHTSSYSDNFWTGRWIHKQDGSDIVAFIVHERLK